MSRLDALRTKLATLIHLRKERINAISFNRRKSQSPTTDEGLISHSALFEQWGFMDYIAARTLLLKVLDASVKLTPKMFYKLSWEQVRGMERAHVVNLSVVGQLIWPACALAATAVEKYAKAIITVSLKKEPKPLHLTSGLIKQVGNCVKNLFCVINRHFLEDLGLLYELRYHTNVRSDPHALAVSVRGVLAELDFTIAQLDKCIQVTANGVVPLDSSYANARLLGSQDLHRENYVLMEIDKDAFCRRHDLQGTLSSIAGPNDAVRAWLPRDNGSLDKFFSIVHIDLAEDPVRIQARKDEHDNMASLLKREAVIMHYVAEKSKKDRAE